MPYHYFDNTRLSTYKRCPRSFLLRHLFHWTREGLSFPLANGGGWHAAMDVIWVGGDIEEAVEAWTNHMLEQGIDVTSNELHDLNFSSMYTRETIRTMLQNYVKRYKATLASVEVLSVEQPFAVPLYEDSTIPAYVGRLDKVIRDRRDHIRVIEHKTSSAYKKGGPFRSTFLESFSPNSQIDGYLYAGALFYGKDFRGIMVDAALMHKTEHNGFQMIPIEKKFEMTDVWLFETKRWIEEIQKEVNELEEYYEEYQEAPFLTLFPRKTEECSSFKGCQFREICKYTPNPLKLDRIPEGFTVKRWEPFNEVRLAELGLEPEDGQGNTR